MKRYYLLGYCDNKKCSEYGGGWIKQSAHSEDKLKDYKIKHVDGKEDDNSNCCIECYDPLTYIIEERVPRFAYISDNDADCTDEELLIIVKDKWNKKLFSLNGAIQISGASCCDRAYNEDEPIMMERLQADYLDLDDADYSINLFQCPYCGKYIVEAEEKA